MSTARPEFSLMRKEHCEKIHRGALEILRRTGITVYHDEALSLLEESGGVVIDGNLVRFQPGLVEWAMPKR